MGSYKFPRGQKSHVFTSTVFVTYQKLSVRFFRWFQYRFQYSSYSKWLIIIIPFLNGYFIGKIIINRDNDYYPLLIGIMIINHFMLAISNRLTQHFQTKPFESTDSFPLPKDLASKACLLASPWNFSKNRGTLHDTRATSQRNKRNACGISPKGVI